MPASTAPAAAARPTGPQQPSYSGYAPQAKLSTAENDDAVLTRLSTELSDMDFMRACALPVSALGATAATQPAASAAPQPFSSLLGYSSAAAQGTAGLASHQPSSSGLPTTAGKAGAAAWAEAKPPTANPAIRQPHEWYGRQHPDAEGKVRTQCCAQHM